MDLVASSASSVERLVVIGPTASGKSGFSDWISGLAQEKSGNSSPTILFDSMQVYREIPVITNQAREREAEPRSVVSVTDEWSVARHMDFVENHLKGHREEKLLIESGTGMYLTSFLLGLKLADEVSPETREKAEANVAQMILKRKVGEGQNFRRLVREEELRLVGSPKRGSVWDGTLLEPTAIVYLRPEREILDRNIMLRSTKIVENGIREAKAVSDIISGGRKVSQTVLDAIGIRELLSVTGGEMTRTEATGKISTRTRQLARRQMRWFDKLVKIIEHDPLLTGMKVIETPHKNPMHDVGDTIRGWIE